MKRKLQIAALVIILAVWGIVDYRLSQAVVNEYTVEERRALFTSYKECMDGGKYKHNSSVWRRVSKQCQQAFPNDA